MLNVINHYRLVVLLSISIATAAFAGMAFSAQDPPSAQVQAQVPAPPDGAEVQASGPIHEAYAKPVAASPEPEPLVAKKPPEAIEELPPDQKPEGANVQWIPGYWSWDEDTSDFIWVSGFWRDTPPGRHWLPGHWQEVDKGWMWVAGYWAPENQTDVNYLPAPPPAEEAGPSTPAPDDTSTYVPGLWVYSSNRYLWRPGHWIPFRAGWVWNPATYIWTPTGYLFVDGYWDHPFGERGLLFAPVRFGAAWWAGARRSFTPSFVVQADFLFGAMFVGPRSHHYFFGNYFEDRFVKRGFVAWPDYRIGKTAFDPNFSYLRLQHRADPKWEAGVHELYRARFAGEVPRPPRTWAEQTKTLAALSAERTGANMAHRNINLTRAEVSTALVPLKSVHNTPMTGLAALGTVRPGQVVNHPVVKLEPVSKVELEREKSAAVRLNVIGQQRHEAEEKILIQGGVPHIHTDPPQSRKVTIPAAVSTGGPTRYAGPPGICSKSRACVAPVMPQHIERPIPAFNPPRPPAPPDRPKKE